jgi:GT2 family glycosyltransferase
MEPYWIITNHDVSFTPGLLEEVSNKAQDKDISLIHPRAGEFYTGTYDFFAITEEGIRTIGLFDENLGPAYGEDSDFIMRAINLNIKTVKGLKNKYFHGDELATDGDESYEANARQTVKEDPLLGEKIWKANGINFGYLNSKWGEGWRLCQPYNSPFNYTTWDIDFIRRKYLGI